MAALKSIVDIEILADMLYTHRSPPDGGSLFYNVFERFVRAMTSAVTEPSFVILVVIKELYDD